jgi:hypothetical protein
MTDTSEAEAPVVAAAAWVPPTGDQEFVFTDMASLPAWADPGWQSNDNTGPALAVPGFVFAEDGAQMDRSQAYHSNIARVGDTVRWIDAEHRFVVVAPTVLAASAEDLAAANIGTPQKDWVNPYATVPVEPSEGATISALQTPNATAVVIDDDDDGDDDKKAAKAKKKK